MDAILSGLVNLGLGGLMAAALVWFLHHLVTRTLPDLTEAFRAELNAGRDQRSKEHQALLATFDKCMLLIGKLGAHQQREHTAILKRLDNGFKELLEQSNANRLAVERLHELRKRHGEPADGLSLPSADNTASSVP